MNPVSWARQQAVRAAAQVVREVQQAVKDLSPPPAAAAAPAAPARDPHSTLSSAAERATAAPGALDQYGRRFGFSPYGPKA